MESATPKATSPNRTLIFGLVGGAVVLLLAAGIGVFLFARGLATERPSAIPELVGAETQFYATITPNLSDVPNVQRLRAAYPDLFVDEDESAARDQLNEFLAIDFEQDILPWISNEMAVAVSGIEDISTLNQTLADEDFATFGEQVDLAIILAARDTDRAREFLAAYSEKQAAAGTTYEQTTHNNVTVYSATADTDGPGAFALVRNNVVFADETPVIIAMIDRDPTGEDTLQNNPDFTAIRADLPENALGYVYIDGSLATQLVEESTADSLATLPPSQAAQLAEQMQNSEALKAIGLSIAIIAAGVQFDATAALDVSKLNAAAASQLEALNEPVATTRVDGISDTALALMTFKIPATFKDQVMEAIRATPDGEESLREFERSIGLNLEQDLLSWFAGDAVIVLLPGEQMGDITTPATGYFALRPLDRTAAQAGMEKIGVVLQQAGASFGMQLSDESIGNGSWTVLKGPDGSQNMGGYGFTPDDLVIAFGDQAIQLAGGAPAVITDDAAFQDVRGNLADPNGGMLYMDVEDMLRVSAENDFLPPDFATSDAGRAVEPIRAVGAAGVPGLNERGVAHGRLFVYFGE